MIAAVGHRARAVGRLLRRRRAAPGAVVLGYHDVLPDGAAPSPWQVSVAQFRSHLDVLDRLGLRVVALDAIADRLRRGEPVDGLAALTFDDALAGVHARALPVLDELGLTATVFVVTRSLGVVPPWWPGAAPTLGPTALAELAAAGWTLGSHTRTHPSLPTLAPPGLHDELVGSRDDLADLLGAPPRALAYPHGHHDPVVRSVASTAGYDVAVTFRNGRITGAEDPLRLPRLTMGPHLRPLRLALQLTRPAGSWPDHQLDRVDGGGTTTGRAP
ncbi:MAG: polysaccharide deacetylase family protein [Acidimicrobiales bacterium]|nr:polysaccharide deacetylase family protein [Acidimicrobiales bacterium]